MKKFLMRAAVLLAAVLTVTLSPVGKSGFNRSEQKSFANTFSYMPFYDLKPQKIVLRAEFSTDYSKSSAERKNNIMLAAKSLDKTLVDAKKEFSFNHTVGERTTRRGYKSAKIIVGGEFIDGVGGGVCQVSSTLYNAVLLAGLPVSEFHPHSLKVSYVAPSFDAMVNSGWADLKFINDTDNPIIIRTAADGNKLTVKIYGEKRQFDYERKSVVTGSIEPPEREVFIDNDRKYPDLYEGESMILTYPKSGTASEGYLLIKKDGKIIERKKLRKDKYSPTREKVIIGTAKRPIAEEKPQDDIESDIIL